MKTGCSNRNIKQKLLSFVSQEKNSFNVLLGLSIGYFLDWHGYSNFRIGAVCVCHTGSCHHACLETKYLVSSSLSHRELYINWSKKESVFLF